MHRLFVYGTLQPGQKGYDKFCARYPVQAKPNAWIKARLFLLPAQGYPAASPGTGKVRGVLLEFSSNGLLAQLDADEASADGSLPANAFKRQPVEVFFGPEPVPVAAFAYLVAPAIVTGLGGVWLPGGRWPA